jgi:hypothetical protein
MTSEIVNRLRQNSECLAPSIMLDAADTIERLTIERDKARRELCHEIFTNGGGLRPSEYARYRGWDCFKQEDGK